MAVRTGVATSETIKEVFENAGVEISYGATPETWRDALTTISGTDASIEPRQTEEVTGWQSTNETVLKTFNEEVTSNKFTVDIVFIKDGKAVEVENPKLGSINGVKEEDHYEFANIESALEDVELTFSFDGEDKTLVKSYSTFTDDIVIL